MEMMLWNIALSAIVAVMGMLLKGKFDELQRISILLNRTREEVARDHITRAEVSFFFMPFILAQNESRRGPPSGCGAFNPGLPGLAAL